MACVAFMLALLGKGGTAIESSFFWEAKANPGYLSRWFFSEEHHSQDTCRVGSLGGENTARILVAYLWGAKAHPGCLSRKFLLGAKAHPGCSSGM